MTAFGKLYACKSLNTYCLYFFSIHKYLHIRIIKASYQQYPILFHRYTAFPVGKICLLGRKLPVDLIQIRFLIGSQNCLFHATVCRYPHCGIRLTGSKIQKIIVPVIRCLALPVNGHILRLRPRNIEISMLSFFQPHCKNRSSGQQGI